MVCTQTTAKVQYIQPSCIFENVGILAFSGWFLLIIANSMFLPPDWTTCGQGIVMRSISISPSHSRIYNLLTVCLEQSFMNFGLIVKFKKLVFI